MPGILALMLFSLVTDTSAEAARGRGKGSCRAELAIRGAAPQNGDDDNGLNIDREFVDGAFADAGMARPGEPNVFNSAALPVSRTPYDERWRRISTALIDCMDSSTLRLLSRADDKDERTAVSNVNSLVNRLVQFEEDGRANGGRDVWSTADETLKRRRGDCEDYAIAKMLMLIALGFDPADLHLSIVKDLVNRTDHAVILIRLNGRFFVLDSNTDRILAEERVRNYRPVFTLSFGRNWIHGVRRDGSSQAAAAF